MSIERISLRLAKALCKATDREADLDYIRYAFEIIIGAVVTTASLYVLASILGVLKECLVISITFALFRAFMGGYHFSHFYKCFSVTVVGFNLVALYTHSFASVHWNQLYLIIMGLLAFVSWMTIKHVPVNAYYRANTLQQRGRFRKITIGLLLIWCILLLWSIRLDWTSTIMSLCFGLGLQAITLPIELLKMKRGNRHANKV
jgi:accessory gene regulator B